MKQISFLILIVFIFTTISSCDKDDDTTNLTHTPQNNPTIDNTPPVITLNGSSTITVVLNSSYTDPGATGNDDHDGAVAVVSDASSTNPDVNHVGTYTITYTATDSSGNIAIAARFVTVQNEASIYDGNYVVSDSISGFVFNYIQTITSDQTINNRIHFNRFCDYSNNSNIYATVYSGNYFTIPFQTAGNIGSGSGACDVATHTFQSISTSQLGTTFTFTYTDAITAPSTCISSASGVATYVKQ